MKTVLFCGAGNWNNRLAIKRDMQQLIKEHGSLFIIRSDGRGADQLIRQVAKALGQVMHTFFADPGGGPQEMAKRHDAMIAKGHPELVIAYTTNLAGSRETADLVRRARAAGIEVQVKEA